MRSAVLQDVQCEAVTNSEQRFLGTRLPCSKNNICNKMGQQQGNTQLRGFVLRPSHHGTLLGDGYRNLATLPNEFLQWVDRLLRPATGFKSEGHPGACWMQALPSWPPWRGGPLPSWL